MDTLLSQALSIYNRQTPLFTKIIKICAISCCYLIVRNIYIKLYRKYKQLPPGPVGYPIFGCFISLATKRHNFYIDMARINNSKCKICLVPLGSLQTILVNDDKLMKELLNKDCVQWRPKNMFAVDITQNIATHDGGENWKERRRFFQTNLITMLNKKFVNENIKILMKQILTPKLNKIVNKIANNENVWHWHGDFQFLTFNIMYNCIYGNYLERNDPIYIAYLTDSIKVLYYTQINVFFYVLFSEKIATFLRRNIFKNKSDYYFRQSIEKCRKWAINAHKKYNKDDLKTYYDYTYNQLSKNLPNAKYDDIITEQVIADFDSALKAGTDTTSATLEYCIVIAAKYTNVQDEVFKELDEICDLSSKKIEEIDILDKILSLHKLRAFIFEVMRLNPVIPGSAFRQLRKEHGLEINVDGIKYVLPDKAIIMSNILGMQMNPKLWRNPDEFDINRWLDKDGIFNRKLNPTIMSFSFGFRDCPGRPLALKTLYLVIAILFSRYRFYFDEPEKIKINRKLEAVLHIYPEIPCKVVER